MRFCLLYLEVLFYFKEEVLNFINFIKSHVDFKFHFVTSIALMVFILIFPALKYMPQSYGFENGLIENIQMCVLFAILFMCIFAKQNKKFFKYVIFALLIIMLREVNLGRTLFFPVEGEVGRFYSWREINAQLGFPLGKCVHGTYGLYIAFVAILFIIKGIFKDVWELIKNTKLPFWNLMFMGISSFLGAIAEKATNNNFIFEEGFELLFYTALAGIVYLYSRDERFSIKEE